MIHWHYYINIFNINYLCLVYFTYAISNKLPNGSFGTNVSKNLESC